MSTGLEIRLSHVYLHSVVIKSTDILSRLLVEEDLILKGLHQ